MAEKNCIHPLTIVILGDSGVGKASIINRYVYNTYSMYARPDKDKDYHTYAIKTISLYENTIELVIRNSVDCSRSPYTYMQSKLMEQANAFMLTFDITDSITLHDLSSWYYEILDCGGDGEMILVGNKCDLEQIRDVSIDEAIAFAKLHEIKEYIETSAKTGYHIHKAFELLVKQTLKTKYNIPAEISTKKKDSEKESEKISKDDLDETKKKKEKEKILRKNLNKAKKEQGTIPVRFIKLFFTGSGAAGKTSFINLLLKKKFSKDHHSTNVVHSSHAVSVKKAVLHESSSEVTWDEFDTEHVLSHLRSILLPKTFKKTAVPHPVARPHSPIIQTPSRDQIPTTNQYKSSKPQNSAIKLLFAGLFISSIKDSNLSTFDNIIDAPESDHITHQPGEIVNIITLLDTGGQPEYIHLLPTINISPTVTFVIHDLSKNLSDQVLVEYSQHGRHMFTPYHLNYTNLDMIKLLMSAANDSIEKSTTDIPQLVISPGTNKESYICLVGTHADKVLPQTKVEIERELNILVNKTDCKKGVWQNDKGKVLFSVNNTTAGHRINEDPTAQLIRSKIEKLAEQKDIFELPITWMIFELEIQNACTKRQQSYISFCDCVTLARKTGLMSKEDEIKSVLLYHHLLGVLIYFDEVPGLCDYVIVDHQWWFDKLSNIICITFQQASLNHQAVQKLKYQGLLSKGLLQHVEWNDDIKEEFFLSLLVHMRIIAPASIEKQETEEYFIPFILPSCNLQQNSQLLEQYGHRLGEPLLVHFQSGLLPRGMFCSLIVELLQHSPSSWHPHFSHEEEVHHTFSNLITFRLHEGYSLSLLDKVSYLEIQIRHAERDVDIQIHNGVYNYLVYALTEVCIHLNFDYERLEYGFVCQCGKGIDNHIAVIQNITPSICYAECSMDSLYLLKLDSSHLVWFSSVQTSLKQDNSLSGNQTVVDPLIEDHIQPAFTSNWHPEATKKVYKDFIVKLLESLPMNDVVFLKLLQHQRLFSGDLKEQVQAKATKREKAACFLDNAIEPPLSIDNFEPLCKLLTIMADEMHLKNDSLKQLASKIKQELDKETSLIAIKETAEVPTETTSVAEENVVTLPSASVSENQNEILKRTPKMFYLTKIVMPKIIDQWEYVAEAFLYDFTTIEAIKERGGGDPKQCCREFFKDWLTTDHGNKVGPQVWSTLLDILNEVDEISAEITDDIATQVKQIKCD